MKKLLYLSIILIIVLIGFLYFPSMKKGTGADKFTQYEWDKNWPQLPNGIVLGNPTGIALDSHENLFVFCRADRAWPLTGPLPKERIAANTILVIDKETGKLIKSWGADMFVMPHGLTIDKEDNIWLTDVGLQQVFKFNQDGKLLMTLGEAYVAGTDQRHFNLPTAVAITHDGSFYVSDGYGNSRIVKFDSSGKFLLEWGTKGRKEKEFDIPHGLALDDQENVYVADRENDRVQVFDPTGKFIKQYADKSFGRICDVYFNQQTKQLIAVDDDGSIHHKGSDVIIFDSNGVVQSRFGRSGQYGGPVCWYHDLVQDKEGTIYIGDILGNTLQKFRKITKH